MCVLVMVHAKINAKSTAFNSDTQDAHIIGPNIKIKYHKNSVIRLAESDISSPL